MYKESLLELILGLGENGFMVTPSCMRSSLAVEAKVHVEVLK